MDNIATESISILTDRQIDYNAGDIATIRLSGTECPLISGTNCFLRFNVILDGNAKAQLEQRAMGASVIERIEVWTGDESTNLETIRGYNELAGLQYHYSQTPGELAKRGLLEGWSNNGQFESIYYAENDNTNVGQTLFRAVEICLPLRLSSILYQKVFPTVATNGLVVKVYFEKRNEKAIRVFTSYGFDTNKAFTLKTALAANAQTTQVVLASTGAPAGQLNANAENCPYVVGSIIQVQDNNGGPQGNVAITAMAVNAAGDVELTTTAFTPTVACDANKKVIGLIVLNNTSVFNATYKIQNLEFIACVVKPGPAYFNSMMKKLKSDGGLVIDYYSFNQYVSNVAASEVHSEKLIPSMESRACTVLNTMMNPAVSYTTDDLRPVIDTLSSYQFTIHQELVPQRAVLTERFNLGGLQFNAQCVHEQTKSLSRCFNVRTECNNGQAFVVGREVSKPSYEANLRDTDLRLKLIYNNPQINKLLVSNIYHLRRLTVTDNGMIVDF